MHNADRPAARPRLAALAPWIFVLLWSTGFVGARFGLPYIEPFTFLLIRFVLAAGLLGAIGLALSGPWPTQAGAWRSVVVGLLLHGGYLGGVFVAIDHGMPASIAALIVSLQPILTAVLAQAGLGERVNGRQWLGLILGLAGVGLVVAEKMVERAAIPAVGGLSLGAATTALLCATLGTLYQRRHGADIPLVGGTLVQYLAAAGLMLPLAYMLETRQIVWTGELIFALAWLVLMLSLGAILLLMFLLRHSGAARTTSLLYLVPPATAIEAYLLFGERFGALALSGLALASLGVALVVVAPAREG